MADGPGPISTALGSSFAAGPGIRPLVHRGALRSARNYPHLLAAARGLRLVDVTCSGATTAHLRHTRQPTLTGRLPPQVEAVTADTAVRGSSSSTTSRCSGVMPRRPPSR